MRRLTSTIVLWTIILTALFSKHVLVSESVFIVIIVVLALAGLAEFYDISEKRGLACFKYCGLAGAALLTVGTFLELTGHIGTQGSPARVNDFETGFIILFVLGLCVRQFVSKTNPNGIVAIAVTLFGLMYVPWLLDFIQKINFFPNVEGKYFLLYFVLVTKFSDMGAYLIGSLIGRHKMIPRISPNKTWEGFGGAIFLSTAASLVFVHFFQDHMYGMNWRHATILGVILSLTLILLRPHRILVQTRGRGEGFRTSFSGYRGHT